MNKPEQLAKHKNLRVLLVEDSEDNQLVFRYHLQSFGATVDIAKNGKDAVEQFTKNTYDLVLMDLQMPIMDGYDATRMIRKWEKDHQFPAVPVIALTASSSEEELQKALDAGCMEHLTKPIQKEDLQKIIFQIGEEKEQVQSPPTSVSAKSSDQYTVMLDPDLEELIPKILEIKRKQAQEIQEAFNDNNFQKLQKLGHKMKGSHGIDTINNLAQSIESAAKKQDLPTIKVLIHQIYDYLDHIEVRFQKE
ncbi:MAG: response regulator [SAR324 cluster bacterium]|nr:response regulator [SAR324 cluster bacterium]